MEEAYLLLGSNLGDREKLLAEAIERIVLRCGKMEQMSSIYESEPWGFSGNNDFLNQVIIINTKLPPQQLLSVILEIEQELGRKRSKDKMVSRVIDIDILFLGQHVVDDHDLKIPHPSIQERRFTLMPLLEISPEKKHPVLKKTMRQLFNECPDELKVASYFDRSLLPKY